MGILLLIYYLRVIDWRLININLSSNLNWWLITLLLLTARTKRAQVPFSSWLPAAIAAPTPVSSLVHSSTLVTAGIYLLFRLDGLFREEFKVLIIILGGVTRLIAGIGAIFEVDIKKIVALSTLRHLGIILILLRFNKVIGFIHLCYHAFFKALLFITVGLWIHRARDYQDLSKVRILFGLRKVNRIFRVVGALRLCGLPLFKWIF